MPLPRALINVQTDTIAARGPHTQVLAYLRGRGLPADQPDHTGPSNFHAHAMIALVEAGRTAEAHRLSAGVLLHGAHDDGEANRFLYARGTLRAASADPAAALDDFLEWAPPERPRGPEPHRHPLAFGRRRMPAGPRPAARRSGPRRGGVPARHGMEHPPGYSAAPCVHWARPPAADAVFNSPPRPSGYCARPPATGLARHRAQHRTPYPVTGPLAQPAMVRPAAASSSPPCWHTAAGGAPPPAWRNHARPLFREAAATAERLGSYACVPPPTLPCAIVAPASITPATPAPQP